MVDSSAFPVECWANQLCLSDLKNDQNAGMQNIRAGRQEISHPSVDGLIIARTDLIG
jgi:hypothetical protein